MKKVLLGLVIAVMMTGSGYATKYKNTLIFKQCYYLKYRAMNIISALEQTESTDFHSLKDRQNFIAEAHDHAALWSIFCGDRTFD